MKRTIILTAVFLTVFAAWTQQPPAQPQSSTSQVVTPKVPYNSDKAQLSVKQESILQLTANDDQKAFQEHMKDLQAQWQTEEGKLVYWITEVKKANGWDDTYTYDRASDKWTHTPKVETKPADTPKK